MISQVLRCLWKSAILQLKPKSIYLMRWSTAINKASCSLTSKDVQYILWFTRVTLLYLHYEYHNLNALNVTFKYVK